MVRRSGECFAYWRGDVIMSLLLVALMTKIDDTHSLVIAGSW